MTSHLYLSSIFLICVFLSGSCNYTNTDQVDLAIAIHYGIIEPRAVDVAGLAGILENLTDRFVIAEDKTRIAIVEFGTKEKLLLTLKQGTHQSNVVLAIDEIGIESYTRAPDYDYSLENVAKRTWNLVIASDQSDRVHVPKIVILITTVERRALGDDRIGLSNITLSNIGKSHAHILALETFRFQSIPIACAFLYRLIVQESLIVKYRHVSRCDPSLPAATLVASATAESLKTCKFNNKSVETCHYDSKHGCVAEVKYNVSIDFECAPNPCGLSQKLLANVTSALRSVGFMYCLKNGSTAPCQKRTDFCDDPLKTCEKLGRWTGECNATCDQSGFAVWEQTRQDRGVNCSFMHELRRCTSECDKDGGKDPILSCLKTVMIALAVAVAIMVPVDIFFVLYVWRVTKKGTAGEKGAKKGRPDSPMEQSVLNMSTTQAQWTVIAPPEITITPQEELVKMYAMESALKDVLLKSKEKAKEDVDTKKAEPVTKNVEVTPKEAVTKKAEAVSKEGHVAPKKAEAVPKHVEAPSKNVEAAPLKAEATMKDTGMAIKKKESTGKKA